MKNRFSNAKGLTLVELVIGLFISSLVLMNVYDVYSRQMLTHRNQNLLLDLQQNLRAAVYFIQNELRMAGYDPKGIYHARITEAEQDRISLTLVADDDDYDNDQDGVIDETGELKTISYDLYDANNDQTIDIGRRVGGQKAACARNIEKLEFLYIMADGSQQLNPSRLDQIRLIQISILGKVEKSDPDFINDTVYRSASGKQWGPFHDNYRRYFVQTSVKCRNLWL